MLLLSQAQKSQGWINTEHSEAGAHSDYTCTYTDFSILAVLHKKTHFNDCYADVRWPFGNTLCIIGCIIGI